MNLELIEEVNINLSKIIAKGDENEELLIEDYLIKVLINNSSSIYVILKLVILKLEIPILDYQGAIDLLNKGLTIEKNINLLLLKFYAETSIGLNSYIQDVNDFEAKTENEEAILYYMEAVYYEKEYEKSVRLLIKSLGKNSKLPVVHLKLIMLYKENKNLKAKHFKYFEELISIIDLEAIYNRDYYSVDNFINEKILLLEITEETFELIKKNKIPRSS
jgi:hypothetical protein